MRFGNAASIVIAVTAAGCATTPKDRLQGKWVGETVDSFTPEQTTRVQGWASGTSFEFRGTRVTITIPAESPREGTFRVAKTSGDELTVAFLRAHGATDEVAFRFEGDDRMRWMLANGQSIVMRRVDD
jgi:hypothetical protein